MVALAVEDIREEEEEAIVVAAVVVAVLHILEGWMEILDILMEFGLVMVK